jgi:cysteine-rich CPCC protein
MDSSVNHPCPCCNTHTLARRGAYDICGVCRWEDDPVQEEHPYFDRGANSVSLVAARRNFSRHGTADPARRAC